MPPCHAIALSLEGTLPPPLVPLEPTLAPSTPSQAPAWPPNVRDLIAELTDVIHTMVRKQVKLEVQAAMTGTHTTSSHRPLGSTTGDTHPSKSAKSTPLEMLLALATLP